eukprot:4610225-Pyramimonas_sp.AAC.1
MLVAEFGNFTIAGCEALPRHAVAREANEKNSYAITTARQRISEARLRAPRRNMDPASCEELFVESGNLCGQESLAGKLLEYSYSPVPMDYTLDYSNRLGTCICIEEERIVITHEARAQALHSSTDIASYELPKTYVRVDTLRSDTKKVYQDGERITFSVKELLEWLDIDLDKPMDQGDQEKWLPNDQVLRDQVKGVYGDVFPRPRLAGNPSAPPCSDLACATRTPVLTFTAGCHHSASPSVGVSAANRNIPVACTNRTRGERIYP